MTIHNPVRPTWHCDACDDAWPCRTRQRELRLEYDGLDALLKAHLIDQLLAAAVGGLQMRHAGELVVRFVGWAFPVNVDRPDDVPRPALDFTGGSTRRRLAR